MNDDDLRLFRAFSLHKRAHTQMTLPHSGGQQIQKLSYLVNTTTRLTRDTATAPSQGPNLELRPQSGTENGKTP